MVADGVNSPKQPSLFIDELKAIFDKCAIHRLNSKPNSLTPQILLFAFWVLSAHGSKSDFEGLATNSITERCLTRKGKLVFNLLLAKGAGRFFLKKGAIY